MYLDNNNHSVFKMKYQLLLMTNNLYSVISEEISSRLKNIFQNISPKYNISLNEWQHKENIIDITFTGHPNTELSKFINAYKSAASRLIKKEFPQITKVLQNGQFWSKTFCLLTLDNEINWDEVRAFIDKQR